jgi:hypothetical protein
MHGIHHSQVREETNSNYSVVLSWWDRLHRTLRLNVPQSRIVIGVPGYSAPEDNELRKLLSMPFQKQRDYWTRPDGEKIRREPEESRAESLLSGRLTRMAGRLMPDLRLKVAEYPSRWLVSRRSRAWSRSFTS